VVYLVVGPTEQVIENLIRKGPLSWQPYARITGTCEQRPIGGQKLCGRCKGGPTILGRGEVCEEEAELIPVGRAFFLQGDVKRAKQAIETPKVAPKELQRPSLKLVEILIREKKLNARRVQTPEPGWLDLVELFKNKV